MDYVERSLQLLANDIKLLKDKAKAASKDPNQFKIILGSSPTTVSDSHFANKNHRFPLTGTIEQIGKIYS